MLFYFVIFGSSAGLFYIADNKKFTLGGKKTRSVNFLLLAIAIFIPCFIAGVRDSSIGYDIQIYGDLQFEYAANFSTYFEYIRTYTDFEKLYQLVTYICARYGNRYIYYFVLQFLTIFPFYLLLREECKNKTWIGMLIYFLWMYPFSLNIMRQSIAIAIVCWGYRYIKRRQFVRFLITVLVALGFHSTAILGIFPYIIYLLVVDDETENKSHMRRMLNKLSNLSKVLIILLSIGIVLFGSQIITFVSQITGDYRRFVLDMAEAGGINVSSLVNLIIMLFALLCLYQIGGNAKSKSDLTGFFLVVVCVGMIIYQLKAISSQMYRLSMYYSCYLIFGIPYLFSISKTSKSKKQLYLGAFILCMVFNFWYFIVFRLWHSVYPYTSQFLGIG